MSCVVPKHFITHEAFLPSPCMSPSLSPALAALLLTPVCPHTSFTHHADLLAGSWVPSLRILLHLSVHIYKIWFQSWVLTSKNSVLEFPIMWFYNPVCV